MLLLSHRLGGQVAAQILVLTSRARCHGFGGLPEMASVLLSNPLGGQVATQILVRTLRVPHVFDVPGSEDWAPYSRILRALLKLYFSSSNRIPNRCFQAWMPDSRILEALLKRQFLAFAPLGGAKRQPRSLCVRSACHTFSTPLAQNIRDQNCAGPPGTAFFQTVSQSNMENGLLNR